MENDSKMIITRTPMRITLGGGGTDLPEYYTKTGGLWANVTIDKYVYVAVKHRFESEMRLAYSILEFVTGTKDIKHPIIREVLKEFAIREHFELNTFADLPGRTGLGSSGAFTVGLIHAIKSMQFEQHDKTKLAEIAYHIERNKLQRTIGKQDQYSAAYGGPRIYSVSTEGKVETSSLPIQSLQQNLMLIYTGTARSAETILSTIKNDSDSLDKIREIGKQSVRALLDEKVNEYGTLMDQHWEVKRNMLDIMSNTYIDGFYEKAKSVGMLGGKIVGAGGGGFMLLVVPSHVHKNIAQLTRLFGFESIPFKFVYEGSEVISW